MSRRADLLRGDVAPNPLYRDRVLVHLLDRSRGLVVEDDDFHEALWILRGDGLVGWREFGQDPNPGGPSTTLTPEGRELAERLARG